MIKPGEIQQRAREAGVRDQQIEKDYVLSWILAGIAVHENLATCLVFKGGTVLKKIYFDDYRFSEDLDFTLLIPEISNEQIFEWFNEMFAYVREETNIPLQIIDKTDHVDGGLAFYISYTGPLGGIGANKRVKVDISRTEELVFKSVKKQGLINYSDEVGYELLCYSLEEVLVEKMRCVMQRAAARDFYDIWYLLEENGMEPGYLLSEFSRKCESKGLKSTDFPQRLEQRLAQYQGQWANSLGDQIKDLPDFDLVVRQVQRIVKKLTF